MEGTITGKFFGKGMREANLKDLATPRKQPKIVLGACDSARRLLGDDDERFFYIVNGAYNSISTQVVASDIRLVGAESDSFSMIEVFGVAIPDAWKLSPLETQKYWVICLKSQLPDLMKDITVFTDTTADMWGKIRSTVDGLLANSSQKTKFYSSLTSVLYSLCRQGNYQQATANKLTTELSAQHGFAMQILNMGVTGYWQTLGKTYTINDMAIIMPKLKAWLKESIVLRNLVEFSTERGLTVYYQVKKALSSYPNFDRALVYACAKNDFENYAIAKELVKDRPYFGYNADIGAAASTRYPTLGYISIALRDIGGEKSMSAFHSTVGDRVNRERWDRVVRDIRNTIWRSLH